MRILVLGYGNIGSVLARDLADSLPSTEVVIAGRHRSKAEETATAIPSENVTGLELDAHDYHNLVQTISTFDVVVGTLPGTLGYRCLQASIDAKVDMVDTSYMPENPFTLHLNALKAGVTIIPDCGVAPGLSNLIVGHTISHLDHVESIHILVGGLPEQPVPPLNYVTTWSVHDLIDEYTRQAKLVKNGKIREVAALTGREEIEFPGVGKLEAFYTDGLRTLLHTVKDVEDMWEKTLRYPGHAEKIDLLKTLGFLDDRSIQVQDTALSPREVTVKLLGEKLQRRDIQDLLAMKIEVRGTSEGAKEMYVHHLLDRYDPESGVTAMARTTAYPASIVAQLLAHKTIDEEGVVPLEKLGKQERFFQTIIAGLVNHQIQITTSVR